MTSLTLNNGFVKGHMRTLLRIEGFAVFLASLALYAHGAHAWKTFFILFLLPDLSLLGYCIGKKSGAIAYNIAHSYCIPLSLMVLGTNDANPQSLSNALIWMSHIWFDRFLGYGLKYTDDFCNTHLGVINLWSKKNP